MIPKYEKLSRTRRQLTFTVVLLLFTVLSVFDLAPDFIVALVGGVLFALLLNELVMYLSALKKL